MSEPTVTTDTPAQAAARAFLHAYGIRTETYTRSGGDHPMMHTLPQAFAAFANGAFADALLPIAPGDDRTTPAAAQAAIDNGDTRVMVVAGRFVVAYVPRVGIPAPDPRLDARAQMLARHAGSVTDGE